MATTKPVLRLLAAIIVCFFISACGFQLRGKVALPAGVEPIYIAGLNANSQLAIELRNLFSASGIKLSTDTVDANYTLNILSNKAEKRSTALGERARVIEYQLIEIVQYEMLNHQKEKVFGPNTITERKIMPNDPNKVASSNEEEKILRREMWQNLAAKIARQISAYDFNPKPVSE